MKTVYFYLFLTAVLLLITSCDMSTGSADPSGVRYKPGTYASSAEGFIDDIKVSVSFSEDKIINITIDEHNETIGRNRVAFAIENIPKNIVQKQSPEVDTVTGATFTSSAIIKAVKDCVTMAKSE